jgi:hypothetical protein
MAAMRSLRRRLMVDQVKVVDRCKSGRSSKVVIASVQRDEAIPRGDIGAYLVGVFACQPLSEDHKSYDLKANGQWRHCIYKMRWQAALGGRDEFTPEQERLVLIGAKLLGTQSRPHGWGSAALGQHHVRRLLECWTKSSPGR